MYNLSYQPPFDINLCKFKSKERGSVKDQIVKYNNSMYEYNILQFNTCIM